MKVTTSERDFGTRGLTEAYQRLDDRLNNPDVGDPLVSFVETLEWCYALEEHLRHRPGEADDKYFAARDTDDPDGQTLAGLILRARKLHPHPRNPGPARGCSRSSHEAYAARPRPGRWCDPPGRSCEGLPMEAARRLASTPTVENTLQGPLLRVPPPGATHNGTARGSQEISARTSLNQPVLASRARTARGSGGDPGANGKTGTL